MVNYDVLTQNRASICELQRLFRFQPYLPIQKTQ
jgi:hypothetical protein